MTKMTAILPSVEAADPAALVTALAHEARAAQRQLAAMPSAARAAALRQAAEALRTAAPQVLAANAQDLAAGKARGLSGAMLDRLMLDEARLAGVADAVAAVADLPDPVGQVIDTSEQPNGLKFQRIRVPIGTIGIIYESRPNVTADAAALCVRAGNAAILRGGSEAVHSNRAIHAALVEGLVAGGVPAAAVQLVPSQTGLCGRDADRERAHRHDRPARRQEPGRAGAGRGARAGARPSRRDQPHLHPRRRRPRNGDGHRGQRQAAPHRHLRVDGDAADRFGLSRGSITGRRADRGRVRSARRLARRRVRPARHPGQR